MNEYAIYHKPESEYAYATSGNSLHIVLRTARGEPFQNVSIIYANKYTFTTVRTQAEMKLEFSDKLYDYYTFDITLEDVRFAYIFRLQQDGKIYYYCEAGLSEDYDFKLAYYTFFQFPYINSDDVTSVLPWANSAVFYQIFIDRFCRGDSFKDETYITQKWEEQIKAKSFAGGDLKGITSKLDYLYGLGITALYLTPIFKSDSNHKYNTVDYLKVDPQFGSSADLKRLITEAHKRGMKVVIDAVFNHCDCNHPKFLDVIKKGRKSKYYDWFIIRGDYPDTEEVNYECFADCGYMPKWNTNNIAVQDWLISLAVRYVYNYGFDGLRLDVSDEVSHKLWRRLREQVKAVNSSALIMGEVWHENTHYLRGDQFDGVMNYKLQKIFIDYFALKTITAEEASDRITEQWLKNTRQASCMMLNFLDNHDTPRFLRYAGGDKNALLSAVAALFMHPGMPCIFYGTEFPLDGAGDPDCRRTFDWDFKNADEQYIAKLKSIICLKKQPAIQSGAFAVSTIGGLLVIKRSAQNEEITAYFNQTDKSILCPQDGKTVLENNCNGNEILPNGVKVLMLNN